MPLTPTIKILCPAAGESRPTDLVVVGSYANVVGRPQVLCSLTYASGMVVTAGPISAPATPWRYRFSNLAATGTGTPASLQVCLLDSSGNMLCPPFGPIPVHIVDGAANCP